MMERTERRRTALSFFLASKEERRQAGGGKEGAKASESSANPPKYPRRHAGGEVGHHQVALSWRFASREGKENKTAPNLETEKVTAR